MAIAATCEYDVRKSAVDTNGGFFNSAAAGTDRSQQTTPQVDIDNSTITTSITTNVITFTAGYTPSSADVGNAVRFASGTNITAGTVFEITAIDAGALTWTVDRNVVSSGTTVNAVGKMGGALLTVGRAYGNYQTGNFCWVQYNATAFASTSTSTNVSNGFISTSSGTQGSQCLLRGFESTHGDIPTTRPTLQVGVNAASTSFIVVSGAMRLEYLIIDCNRANFTNTKGVRYASALNVFQVNVKIMNASVGAIDHASTDRLTCVGCEVTGCATTTAIACSSGGHLALIGCNIHDNTVDGISANSTASIFGYYTIFDTNKNGASNTHVNLSATGVFCRFENCVFYNAGTNGVTISQNITSVFINCIFEENGAYGVGTSAAGTYALFMWNCAFYNNTSGKYDTTKVPSRQIYGEINNTTGTFFTDAANADFTLNNTTNQGALARNTAYPASYPGASSTTNYNDVGASRHQDPAGSAGMLYVPGLSGGMDG